MTKPSRRRGPTLEEALTLALDTLELLAGAVKPTVPSGRRLTRAVAVLDRQYSLLLAAPALLRACEALLRERRGDARDPVARAAADAIARAREGEA